MNPVGRMPALVIQMPFLFAYYRMLGVALELRQAPGSGSAICRRPTSGISADLHYHQHAVDAEDDAAAPAWIRRSSR